MADDDRPPRWVVRWLITLLLLVVLAGIGYVIYWELTLPDRVEAEMRRASCDFARQVALSEPDPQKANLLAASARIVCLGQ